MLWKKKSCKTGRFWVNPNVEVDYHDGKVLFSNIGNSFSDDVCLNLDGYRNQ